MPQITQIAVAVPQPAALQQLLFGASAMPAWLALETANRSQFTGWGVSGLAAGWPPGGLYPRSTDGAGADAPAGVVLATVDLERAEADLAPLLGTGWTDVGDDPLLGARCRRLGLGSGVLVLAEPSTEGYAAACLARFGEGPIAVAMPAPWAAIAGVRAVASNPVDDRPAGYLRIGPGTAPTFILLAA